MRPTLQPGDRLVVIGWGRIRSGDVVAARDPRAPARMVVKRVAATSAAGLELAGDALADSTDSRHFGIVPWPLVLGRVIYRYFPPDRAQRLRRSG